MHLCEGNGLLTRTGPEEHQRLKKKQKNRAAAQRSRQKHTDKADALHQQHEMLEKHNRLLQKEIQGLQAELLWWSQTLRAHERLCLMDCATCLDPVPPGCWGQTERPPDPMPDGQYGFQEQPGLFQTPASSPLAHQLSPDPQPHGSSGLHLSLLPSLSPGSIAVAVPPPQLSPSPVQSASPTGSSLLRPSSKFNTLLPSPPAQPAPLQPLVAKHPTSGKLGSSPDSPSPALGLACLQGREHRPMLSATDQQGPGVDPGPHPLLAFPLLASAQVHF